MSRRIDADSITCTRETFALRFAFSHAGASRELVETLIVRVGEGGSAGWGQALPRSYLTGETIASCREDLETLWPGKIAGVDFPADEKAAAGDFLDCLRGLYREADENRKNASYAALEIAAVDWLCRTNAIAGQTMWGSVPAALPLVAVIPLLGPRKAYWLSLALRCMGYRRFKVKVGRDRVADDRRLAAVRRAVGSASWLCVDANAAWEADEAVERIAGLKKFAVDLVEEPLCADALAGLSLGELERRTGRPLMADESLCTLADARTMLRRGTPSWWNVRLAKNGGFSGVRELGGMALAAGIKLYGGVLVGETSCLAAAGRAAMGLASYECMEYGFPRIFVKADPFRGGPGGFFGSAGPLPVGRFGLGVKREICRKL